VSARPPTVFMAKTGAFFFFTFGALSLASTFARSTRCGCMARIPGGHVGRLAARFLYGHARGRAAGDGALGMERRRHTFSFNVFLPALVPLGVIFTGAALWPFIEQWITGDKREHHVNDRPRNAPTRTALGIAVITFYGVLWLEGANDVIAFNFNVPLYTTTRIAQVAMFAGLSSRTS